MSICSQMSQMSVSYCGSEVSLESAVDSCFKSLQKHLNNSQCSLRSLAMLVDQDNDFKSAVRLGYEITEDVNGMQALFKELKSLVRQITPKPESDEEKQWAKDFIAEKKLEAENEKNRKKLEKSTV